MAVTYTIKEYESGSTVSVDFTDGDVSYTRNVNIVTVDGAYDAELTEIRVQEVARGVENKIALGVISNSETPTG